MKKCAAAVMRAVFCFCRLFPVQQNKLALFSNFPIWGSLGTLGEYLERRGEWKTVRLTPRSPLLLWHLATARVVLLNNNFSPLDHLPFAPGTKRIQLWHADGALKKWGRSVGARGSLCDYAICASEQARPYWAEAFGLPAENVLPLGSPRLDQLRRRGRTSAARFALYAPTFRDDPARNAALLSHFDFDAFARAFPDLQLLVSLHPKLHGQYTLPAGVTDATGLTDAYLPACDCLITDYSSVCVDAAALDIPVFLYLFDEADYVGRERGFYMPLRQLAPGPVSTTFEGLLAHMAQPDQSRERRRAFAAFHAGAADGRACERIADFLRQI